MARKKLTDEQAIARFKSMADTSGSCWTWKGKLNGNGYGAFCWNGLNELAHRASYILFKGEIPDGKCICHSCDVRNCVNPDHLWVGTYSDNIRDCIGKGRFRPYDRRGERNPTSLLTNEQRLEIVRLRQAGVPRAEVASMFGVGEWVVKYTTSRHRTSPGWLAPPEPQAGSEPAWSRAGTPSDRPRSADTRARPRSRRR